MGTLSCPGGPAKSSRCPCMHACPLQAPRCRTADQCWGLMQGAHRAHAMLCAVGWSAPAISAAACAASASSDSGAPAAHAYQDHNSVPPGALLDTCVLAAQVYAPSKAQSAPPVNCSTAARLQRRTRKQVAVLAVHDRRAAPRCHLVGARPRMLRSGAPTTGAAGGSVARLGHFV